DLQQFLVLPGVRVVSLGIGPQEIVETEFLDPRAGLVLAEPEDRLGGEGTFAGIPGESLEGRIGLAHVEQALGLSLQGADGIVRHGSLPDQRVSRGQTQSPWPSWPGGGIGTSSGSDFRLPRMWDGTLSKKV